jgi:hypothetical protein
MFKVISIDNHTRFNLIIACECEREPQILIRVPFEFESRYFSINLLDIVNFLLLLRTPLS